LSRHGKVRVWALQMDIVNFFHTIHLPTLWAQLQPVLGPSPRRYAPPLSRGAGEGKLLQVQGPSPTVCERDRRHRRPGPGDGDALPFDLAATVQALLADRPGLVAQRIGPAAFFARVPHHKRLGAQEHDRGLPIGNLLSQWFANAYLDPLDHFIQRQLGIGAYVWYMDDFVLVSNDRHRLAAARDAIIAFLRDRLKLDVHSDRPVRAMSEGVDFAGAIIRPGYALTRRRTVKDWQARVAEACQPHRPRIVDAGQSVVLSGLGRVHGPAAVWHLDAEAGDRLRTAWASGRACVGHTAGAQLSARAWKSQPLLGRVLRRRKRKISLNHLDLMATRHRRVWPNFRAQRQALQRQAPDAIVLVRVGGRIEVAEPRDARRLGVRWISKTGRRFGTPVGKAGRLIDAALAQGWPVAIACETGTVVGACPNRVLTWWVEPLARAERWWQAQFGQALGVDASGRANLPRVATWLRRTPRPRPSREGGNNPRHSREGGNPGQYTFDFTALPDPEKP